MITKVEETKEWLNSHLVQVEQELTTAMNSHARLQGMKDCISNLIKILDETNNEPSEQETPAEPASDTGNDKDS